MTMTGGAAEAVFSSDFDLEDALDVPDGWWGGAGGGGAVVRGGVLPLDEEEESADPGFRNTPSDIVIAGLIVSIPGSSLGGGSSGAVEDAVVDAKNYAWEKIKEARKRLGGKAFAS